MSNTFATTVSTRCDWLAARSAQTARAISELAGKFSWGMSHADAMKLVVADLRRRYEEKIKARKMTAEAQEKAEKELNGAVECMYIGPGEHGGGEEQVQIVQDLIAKRAISQKEADDAATALRQSEANVQRANVLTELRDTLLPHLISGKLRLPEAQAQLEDALA